ncbi:MAG: hypothetical protein JSU66_08005, partial [Deltaproteobacteria bacterium]
MRGSTNKRIWAWAVGVFVAVAAGAWAADFDLWIHPRNETYDPKIHYRDATGELYYHAENDIQAAMDNVVVNGGERRVVTVALGPDLLARAERDGASLLPVFLWDSDGNDTIDRSFRGSLEGRTATFDSPQLADIALRKTHWQIGVKYHADPTGLPEYDGRYLASIDSRTARIRYEGIAGLPDVGAAVAPGLVIFKHRASEPFDLGDFIQRPAPYLEGFSQLTRIEDDDDWTVEGDRGRLMTHYREENLFLVRTEGGYALDVEWGDMPVEEFFTQFLQVPRNGDGCYSSLDSELTSFDGEPVVVPNRLFYCPDRDIALFDVPPGYEIGLSAVEPDVEDEDEALLEYTEAGQSIRENMTLWADQVHPRRPVSRGTGTILGNVKAGYRDAGDDLVDAARDLTTGTTPENIHSGERVYQASPVTMLPRAMINLARVRPLAAFADLWDGIQSTVQATAHVTSAVSNGIVNPLVQFTVGAASPDAADTTSDVLGVAVVGLVKNLPVSERSVQAISPQSLWRHDRAFAPSYFTRTDTELNIDRVLTIVNYVWIGAVIDHNSS